MQSSPKYNIFLFFRLAVSMALAQTTTTIHNLTCGVDTYLDDDTNTCLCDISNACPSDAAGSTIARNDHDDDTSFRIGVVYDVANRQWTTEVINFTVSLLNNHTDGWHDDVLNDGTIIEYDIRNSGCDEAEAMAAYWEVREDIHAILGARCSGASTAVALVAGLENITQISPSSTSSRLSDVDAFPHFFRTVAPDNANGEVGATIAMLRSLGWNRVTILRTDTRWAKDVTTEFHALWGKERKDEETGELLGEGEVAYSNTITLEDTGEIDEESVRQALRDVPTDNPVVNSRVILLAAHDQHAFRILEIAAEMNFQPDTIWVGWAWIGLHPKSMSWVPPVPGYLGLTPYQNENEYYQDFLQRLQAQQRSEGRIPWESFDHYTIGYAVDAIVALAKAVSQVPPEERRNGNFVSAALRNVSFHDGVSGPFSFNADGDRHDPRYSVVNYQRDGEGGFEWVIVGDTGTDIDSVKIETSTVCFAELGCGVDVPSDKYPPVPTAKFVLWALIVVLLISFALLAVVYKYWKTRQGKQKLIKSMSEMQKKMEDLAKIDRDLAHIDKEVETAKEKKNRLILQRSALQGKPNNWTDTDETLVEVSPTDEQYWNVLEKLQGTMKDAYISKLWRVQNKSLWSYYAFHKHRLALNGVDENERSVWHGTSNLDPAVIYNDRQDGFMMQFSRDGFWGRGIYFADNSSYSFSYSYKPSALPTKKRTPSDRDQGADDEREMFLTQLLVGNEVFMDRDASTRMADECRALTAPPTDPKTNQKYNTVCGTSGESKVYVVYENGRAYPNFLVRFYRGPYDASRSPYKCKKEVPTKHKRKDSMGDPELGRAKSKVIWEFLSEKGWVAYDDQSQKEIEKAYAELSVNPSKKTIKIWTDAWMYEVDVHSMKQTNLEHPERTIRDIRRVAKT